MIFFFYCRKSKDLPLSVLLIHSSAKIEDFSAIKNAYSSVLEEEGIPFQWKHFHYLLEKDTSILLKNHPAVIFPDRFASYLPVDLRLWLEDYLSSGGKAMLVYDCGSKNKELRFLENSIFTKLVGLDYVFYDQLGSAAYADVPVKFSQKKDADFFGFPPGKLNDENKIVSYGYNELKYSVARCQDISKNPGKSKVFSYAIYPDDKEINSSLKTISKGQLFFVNLPLGYLKAFGSDDLIARTHLRTFLFKICKIPHLVNAPFAQGGLNLNFHIDDNEEKKAVNKMIQNEIIRPDLEYSFSVCAGDFLNEPGDGLGLDVQHQGASVVKKLMKYGVIGSHGGWAHNWFAEKMKKEELTRSEIKKYIAKNKTVLEEITGYQITEYASPEGIHPQPLQTEILEELGFCCYYYPGDAGSGPNRTFAQGKMVSKNVVAFPVMPNRQLASIQEMAWENVSPAEFYDWLNDLKEYVIKNKLVRMLYSHPNDLNNNQQYIPQFSRFLDELQTAQQTGEIQVKPLSYFSEFVTRFLRTEFYFFQTKNGIKIELENPQSLAGISVALPTAKYQIPNNENFYIRLEKDYFYLICDEDVKNITVECLDN